MTPAGPWSTFTTVELETKRAELHKLVDSGLLTPRSADQQLTEISHIDNELAQRNGQ